MTSFFDKLNLRPGERRALVVVGLAVFAVINVVWVWPRFGERQATEQKIADARAKLEKYNNEIKQLPGLQQKIIEFDVASREVPSEDQLTTLMRAYQSQAAESGVLITSTARPTTKTNESFLEQSQTISIQCDEGQLVDFLYKLGAGGSSIRVRSLTLRPDPPRHKLQGNVTLVASFQRKVAARAPAPAAVPVKSAAASKAATASKPLVTRTNATPSRTNSSVTVKEPVPKPAATPKATGTTEGKGTKKP